MIYDKMKVQIFFLYISISTKTCFLDFTKFRKE